MSLELDIADYIALNDQLVVDTDLFIGEEPPDSPDACVTIVGSPGSDTESGIAIRSIQIIARDTSYVPTQEMAGDVYRLLMNKPGFPNTIRNVFYCESLNSPYPLERDARGRYVFVSNLLFRMLVSEDEES